MNGTLTQIALWAVNALLGIILLLIGAVMRTHWQLDDERHKDVREEIARLRARRHDMANDVTELRAKNYMREQQERTK